MENITTIAKEVKNSISDREKSINQIVSVINGNIEQSLDKEHELLLKSSEHYKNTLQGSIENLSVIKQDLTRVKQEHEKVFIECQNTLQQIENVIEAKRNLITLVISFIVLSVFLVPLAFKLDAKSYQNYLEQSCNSEKTFTACYK